MLSGSNSVPLCPITLLFDKIIGTFPKRPWKDSELNMWQWASGGFAHLLSDGVDKSLFPSGILSDSQLNRLSMKPMCADSRAKTLWYQQAIKETDGVTLSISK